MVGNFATPTINAAMPNTLVALTTTQRLAPRLVAVLVVVASVAALSVALPAAWSDIQTIKYRWLIDRWSSGTMSPPTPAQWGEARHALANGLRTQPNNPAILENLAWLYASRSQSLRQTLPQASQDFMRQAHSYYLAAVRQRPMSAVAWANVALSAHYLSAQPEELQLWPAFDKALDWGHREPTAQRPIAEIGFARWSTLTPQRQAALLAMVNNAQPHSRPSLVAIAKQYKLSHLLQTEPASQPASTATAR